MSGSYRGDRFELAFDVLVEASLPDGLDLTRLEPLARSVLAKEQATGSWTVSVALVDDGRIRDLHREFMAIDEATDVMTFPLDEEPSRSGGDIAISVDRAAEQGPEFGHSALQEIAFLVVHGLLHLCGWDDPDPDERARMLERQTELLTAFDAEQKGASDGERRDSLHQQRGPSVR